MSYHFKLTHSLNKIFFEKDKALPTLDTATMFKNEIYSFQLVATMDEPLWPNQASIHIEIDSPLVPYIRL